MRAAIATTVLVGVLAAGSLPAETATAGASPAGASPAGANPTPAQIRTAIARAQRARTLWATVNICDTRADPKVLGVRGQMPSLGFASWMSMEIHLDYYNRAKKTFVTDPGTAKTLRLGRSAHGLQQGGVTYTFRGATPMLQASVRFIWRRSGQTLGTTPMLTTGGHPSADFGSPPRFSAATCQIR
ncbi:MAG: hypothetical protein ABI355_13580 [Solirubrobacteraceae bacterium]